MSKTISALNYNQLVRDVRKEMETGRRGLETAYRRQVVVTHWNIGRILSGVMPDEKPSAANAAVMKRLAKDFGRPNGFFYSLLKFYRYYPRLPKTDLTWVHYLHLLGVDDAQKRRALELKVIADGISTNRLKTMLAKPPRPMRLPSAEAGRLTFERGRLYHYEAVANPRFPVGEGRVLADIGFSIEREVPAAAGTVFHTGYVLRAVKKDEAYTVKISTQDKTRLYTYAAYCERVIDGDTVLARVDLGFRTWITQKLRLRGIDCPERTTSLGEKALRFVRDRLKDCGNRMVVKTYKDDKYGRMLADVFYASRHPESAMRITEGRTKDLKKRSNNNTSHVPRPTSYVETDPETVAEKGTYLNQQLLDEGLAELWNG